LATVAVKGLVLEPLYVFNDLTVRSKQAMIGLVVELVESMATVVERLESVTVTVFAVTDIYV